MDATDGSWSLHAVSRQTSSNQKKKRIEKRKNSLRLGGKQLPIRLRCNPFRLPARGGGAAAGHEDTGGGGRGPPRWFTARGRRLFFLHTPAWRCSFPLSPQFQCSAVVQFSSRSHSLDRNVLHFISLHFLVAFPPKCPPPMSVGSLVSCFVSNQSILLSLAMISTNISCCFRPFSLVSSMFRSSIAVLLPYNHLQVNILK